MNPSPRLTSVAQEAVAAVLSSGDRAIDATMGNGHDTLFLAREVGKQGRVIAFDIQPQALEITREALHQAGLAPRATLHRIGHEQMLATVPDDWPGSVGAVMFNLGYLPGGDRQCVTQPDSTLAALDQGLRLLRPDGCLSLLLYRGHSGADSETRAVEDWMQRIHPTHRISRYESPGPVLFVVQSGSSDITGV